MTIKVTQTTNSFSVKIQQPIPQLVSSNQDTKTVNYNGLVGILIQAIKEQQSQIEELRSIIKHQ